MQFKSVNAKTSVYINVYVLTICDEYMQWKQTCHFFSTDHLDAATRATVN